MIRYNTKKASASSACLALSIISSQVEVRYSN